MLEIIAQILCTMLALTGVNFIVQAFVHMKSIHAAAFVLSLLAGIFTLIVAMIFFHMVEDQASGARKAIDAIQQQLDYAPEAVLPD